jgi:ureidoacrylate peracid hydrolase
MALPHPTTRDLPVVAPHTTLLFIDVQNFCAIPEGGEWANMMPAELSKLDYFFAEMSGRVIPNMQRLQAACRAAGIEVMYTIIRNLTKDGRDRSLDYKITGFNVPPDSWDGQVIDAIKPGDDEMVLPKTSSDVFHSTNIDYILRNLETKHLVISGIVTDQCIEGSVRSACDKGYLVTLVTDACTTYSQDRHDNSLRAIKGYCRQRTTAEFVAEISGAEISGAEISARS